MATDKEIQKALSKNIGYKLYYFSEGSRRWKFVINDISKRILQNLARAYKQAGIKTKIKEWKLVK